jgi:hypothetical protein
MRNTLIIGLGHKARHGKDTAAEHIAATYGDKYQIKCYAFADNLKAEFYDATCQRNHPYWRSGVAPSGFDSVHMRKSAITKQEKVAWCNENKSVTGPHLQVYGTEFRRKQNNFYWVDALRAEIEHDSPQIALIKDTRFPDEGVFVKSEGGYVVKCERRGFLDPNRDPNHISETALDSWPFDFIVSAADGAVEELLSGIEEVFETIINLQTPVSEAA